MARLFHWNGKLITPKALRLSHDAARAELVRAAMEGGSIALAAKRLAEVCLPHFEREEESIFPVLGLLPELVQGNLRPEMGQVLPLISDFSARHEALDQQHQSIQSAIDALLEACQGEKNREFAEFAYTMRVHEKLEDEVIYPMVLHLGNYLQERLAL